jgi:hypothetical protein
VVLHPASWYRRVPVIGKKERGGAGRSVVRPEGRGKKKTHLQQPQIRVGDFCQHVLNILQFEVPSADLSKEEEREKYKHSAVERRGKRRKKTHKEVGSGYLSVEDDATVL